MPNHYPIITLCGSTKFKDLFIEKYRELSLHGWIVLNVVQFTHADNLIITDEEKEMFDDMHKAKIAMSDAIYVINKDSYIGESTRSEIEFAKSLNKAIYYLE